MVQELTHKNANAAVVFAMYDAFAKGDIEGVLNEMHPDIKLNSPTPFGGDMDIMSFPIFLQEVGTRSNGTLKLHPVDTLVSENRVAVLMDITLTTKGVDHLVKSVHLWEFEGGKPIAWRELPYVPQQFIDVWS